MKFNNKKLKVSESMVVQAWLNDNDFHKRKRTVYLQNNPVVIPFIQQNIPTMKNRLLAFLMLVLAAISISSCYSSRKGSGCPMNPQSQSKFRG
jgi:hypothetical protein